jgi:hypothetical protein
LGATSVTDDFQSESGRYLQVLAVFSAGCTAGAGTGAGGLADVSGPRTKTIGDLLLTSWSRQSMPELAHETQWMFDIYTPVRIHRTPQERDGLRCTIFLIWESERNYEGSRHYILGRLQSLAWHNRKRTTITPLQKAACSRKTKGYQPQRTLFRPFPAGQ